MNDVSFSRLGRALGATALAGTLFVAVVRLAVQAYLPSWAAALLVPLAAMALTVSLAHLAATLGWKSRPALTVTLVAEALGLPLLGLFSLSDPWESEYAEVAREILERHDFVSLWFAHEGWFRSKPVLLFWMEALSMKLFGVGVQLDGILAGAHGALAHPEWAVRLPSFFAIVLGAGILQLGVARSSGRRAGTLVAAVFLTMSGTVLLAAQSITDSPLLGATAAALGFLAAAEATGDDLQTREIRVRLGERSFVLHAGHLVAAALIVLVGAQLVMILGSAAVRAGSPQACTLPGQPACAAVKMAVPRLTPLIQSFLWLPPLLYLVVTFADERRVHRLLLAGAWMAAGLATMAKGPVGLVVPAAGAFLALVSTRSLRGLLRLEIVRGLLIVVLLVVPWYLASYARHGKPFVDELVFRNMIGRTLDHLHDTNSSEDTGLSYFARQLGYATFPWSGVAAVAMLVAGRRGDRASSPRDRVRVLFFGSALAAFVLVSTMSTKFHHYVLVAIPAVAGVTGLFVRERLAQKGGRGVLVLALAAAAITLLVGLDFTLPVATDGQAVTSGAARFMHLVTYRYDRHWMSSARYLPFLGVAASVFALLVTSWAVSRVRPLFVRVFVACAAGFAAWLGSGYLSTVTHDGGQRDMIALYEQARGSSNEPLVAYEMNWKGENFYTANDTAVFINGGQPLKAWVEAQRSRTPSLYIATERGRVRGLRAELGTVKAFTEIAPRTVADEYALVRVDL